MFSAFLCPLPSPVAFTGLKGEAGGEGWAKPLGSGAGWCGGTSAFLSWLEPRLIQGVEGKCFCMHVCEQAHTHITTTPGHAGGPFSRMQIPGKDDGPDIVWDSVDFGRKVPWDLGTVRGSVRSLPTSHSIFHGFTDIICKWRWDFRVFSGGC